MTHTQQITHALAEDMMHNPEYDGIGVLPFSELLFEADWLLGRSLTGSLA